MNYCYKISSDHFFSKKISNRFTNYQKFNLKLYDTFNGVKTSGPAFIRASFAFAAKANSSSFIFTKKPFGYHSKGKWSKTLKDGKTISKKRLAFSSKSRGSRSCLPDRLAFVVGAGQKINFSPFSPFFKKNKRKICRNFESRCSASRFFSVSNHKNLRPLLHSKFLRNQVLCLASAQGFSQREKTWNQGFGPSPVCIGLKNRKYREIRHFAIGAGKKVRAISNQEENILPNSQTSRTIVITSGKGGVGKTTATANLGMSIARLGYRVALIDADIGLRNLDLLLGLENRILYTAMDILEGQCRLDQALIRDKRWKNLSLLSISKNRQRYNVTRKNMENLVKSISSLGYHFILIDCPAGIDVGFINAIAPAEEALIITTPEITAIRDADRVAGLLEANGIYNVKLLVNRVRPDMIQKNDMMSVRDVQEMLGIPLLGAIPEDNHVIISTNRGEPLVLKKKLTLSGIAFENAARRLIGKQDYFIDLASPYKGVFQKVQELFFRL